MTDTPNPNMAIWDEVCVTNVSATKKVKYGKENPREFTAIDAYSQFREATRLFGAAGRGWGWTIIHQIVQQAGESSYLILQVHFWYVYAGERGEFHELGVADLARRKEDAGKTALTDALTKALSRLGFNADVFLGKFDDNRYVADLKRQQAEVVFALRERAAAAVEDTELTAILTEAEALSVGEGAKQTIREAVAKRSEHRMARAVIFVRQKPPAKLRSLYGVLKERWDVFRRAQILDAILDRKNLDAEFLGIIGNDLHNNVPDPDGKGLALREEDAERLRRKAEELVAKT